jgi:hypothetical protein
MVLKIQTTRSPFKFKLHHEKNGFSRGMKGGGAILKTPPTEP